MKRGKKELYNRLRWFSYCCSCGEEGIMKELKPEGSTIIMRGYERNINWFTNASSCINRVSSKDG